jgi:hypothetical protein
VESKVSSLDMCSNDRINNNSSLIREDKGGYRLSSPHPTSPASRGGVITNVTEINSLAPMREREENQVESTKLRFSGEGE